MKSIISIQKSYFLILIFSFILIACKKEKTDVGNPDSHVNWRVNTTNYTSNRGAFVSIVSGGTTQVYAVSSDGSVISINLTDCNAPGIWIAAMPGTPGLNASVLLETSANDYESFNNTGSDKLTINVSQINSTSIKGSFSGILTATGNITANVSGDFEVFF